MVTLRRLFRALGITLQILVLGELLFIAVATMYAMRTGTHVFRYAGF